MSIIISRNGSPAKPNGNKVGWLRQCRNLYKFNGDIQQIVDKISHGYTIYTNVLDLSANHGANVNFQKFLSSEWVGLDFDNTSDSHERLQNPDYLTMDDCIEKMKSMGLYPAIVYPTFSFTPEHHKFRVLFHLNEVIPKENQRKLCILLKMLMTLFPKCDQNCTDFARMFFGTNKPINTFYIDEDARLDEQTLWQRYVSFVNSSISTSSDMSSKWKDTAKNWAVKLIGTPQMPNVRTEESNPVIDFEFVEGYAEQSFQMAKSYKPPENDDSSDEQNIAASTNNQTPTANSQHRRNNNVPRSNEEAPHQIRIRNWENKFIWMSMLYRKFVNGECRLNYQQRFFFVSNLRFIEGGITHFLQHIEENISLYEEDHDYDYYKKQVGDMMRSARYKCSLAYLQNNSGENLYPYDDYLTGCGCANIFEALKQRILLPKRVAVTRKSPVDKANWKLRQCFEKALLCPGNAIHAIRAGVGVGKTELYTHSDYSKYERVLFAVPTHDLACEVEQRLIEAGHQNIVRIRKRPTLPYPEDEAQYQKYLKAGLTKQAHEFYTRCCAPYQDAPSGHEEYERSLRNASRAHIVICTHAYLSLAVEPNDYSLVIIDEDIKSSFLSTKTCSYDALVDFYSSRVFPEKKEKYLPLVEQLNREYETIASDTTYSYVYSEPISTVAIDSGFSEDDFDIASLDNSPNSELSYENAAYFAQSNSFTISEDKTVSFVNKLPYKPLCKTIILSATMNKLITKKLFTPRMFHWYSIPEIRNQQRVIQDITYSCSSTCLSNRFDTVVDYIKSVVPDYTNYTVLTFKKCVERFVEAGFHAERNSEGNYYAFGNLDGVDELNGKNLLIIGKLSLAEPIYKLLANALGLHISDGRQHKHYQQIGDYVTFFYSFSDENLLAVQMGTAQASIVQAAGRARTARTNAKVLIFSDIPVPIADEIRYMNVPIGENSNRAIKQRYLAS